MPPTQNIRDSSKFTLTQLTVFNYLVLLNLLFRDITQANGKIIKLKESHNLTDLVMVILNPEDRHILNAYLFVKIQN